MGAVPRPARLASGIALVIASACACAPTTASLEVQLVSDYAPGRDFDAVSTTIDGAPSTETAPAATDRSYGRAVRVARFDALAPGRTRVVVELENDGRSVQSQPRIVTLRAGQTSVVTVSISRDCEGVTCPADVPSAIACLGGVCVDPECSPEHPELCATACLPACVPGSIACVTRRCLPEGVCFDETDDTQCGAGEICVADLGCRAPFVAPADDDASMDADADVDANIAADTGIDTGNDADIEEVPRRRGRERAIEVREHVADPRARRLHAILTVAVLRRQVARDLNGEAALALGAQARVDHHDASAPREPVLPRELVEQAERLRATLRIRRHDRAPREPRCERDDLRPADARRIVVVEHDGCVVRARPRRERVVVA